MQASVSAPLTVVQVIPELDAGSVGGGVVQLSEALVEAGHRAIVVSEGGRLEQAAAHVGATVMRLPVASKSPSQIVANGKRLAALARAAGASLMHAQGRAPAWSCLVASRLSSVPFVATVSSGYREQNPLKRLYNSVMVRGARVIANGDRLATMIETRYGTPRERIAVIQRGVDLAVFDPARVDAARRETLARRWGLRASDRVILVPGRISRRKGLHTLVDAVVRLREAGLRDFVCIIAGEDQGHSRYAAALWDRVHQSGLAETIRLVGHCPDMPAAYALADIAVSTVLPPGGPQQGMLEAQAMQVPVVVSDAGPCEGIVRAPPFVAERQASGFLYPAGNAAELAQTLFKVLAMGAPGRTAMGARGRDYVAGRHPRQAFTARMLAIYAEVAAPRRMTASQPLT